MLEMPSKLFKGLEPQYANAFLRGELLFRSYSYFMRTEDTARHDGFDGRHVDAPTHEVNIEVLSTGKNIRGEFEFHNICGKPDKIFCFCSSMNANAIAKFGGAKIEILDVKELSSRIQKYLTRLGRLIRLDSPLPLASAITYYSSTKAAPSKTDVKNPRELAFLKRDIYSEENEFRFVFSRRGGISLIQKLTTKAYEPADDLLSIVDKQILLKLGSLNDIAREID